LVDLGSRDVANVGRQCGSVQPWLILIQPMSPEK
jgi:hypothetical protein